MISRKEVFAGMFIAMGAMFITSCEREAEIHPEILETVQEEALATAVFDDVFSQGEMGENSAFSIALKSGEVVAVATCPTVTITPVGQTFPKTITIDFGTAGCSDADDNVRTGKILVSITGRHHTAGSVKTVTFENYTFNGVEVRGTKTVTNNGTNNNGNMYWTINVQDAVITSPEGVSFQWESVRTREWVEGAATPLVVRDDVYQITGQTTGINRLEREFSVTIQSPLVVRLNCRSIVQGSILIQVTGRPDAILDYGDGTCDNLATITANGETKTITLRRR